MMKSHFHVALMVICLVSPATAAELYFPGDDWKTVKPAAAGWDSDKLSAAIDFAMSRKSSGVVVLHRGRIMAERHQDLKTKSIRYRRMIKGQADDGGMIEDVASVQKSVACFLVGIAQDGQQQLHNVIGIHNLSTRDLPSRNALNVTGLAIERVNKTRPVRSRERKTLDAISE